MFYMLAKYWMVTLSADEPLFQWNDLAYAQAMIAMNRVINLPSLSINFSEQTGEATAPPADVYMIGWLQTLCDSQPLLYYPTIL